MAQRRAFCAPDGIRRAVGKLDQIQRVLDERVKPVERTEFSGVELAGHAAVQDRQRLRADVFAHLEEFKEAEAERLEIIRRGAMEKFVVPAVDEQLALLHRADGVFPLIAFV